MSLLLCHECFTWVEPVDERCPDCGHRVDPAVPDPSLTALAREIGGEPRAIGEVRVRRATLPDRGTLYATSRGYLFLPHVPASEIRMVETTESGSSLMWTLASVAFPLLVFLLPFLRPKKLEPKPVETYRPAPLGAADGPELAGRLMQDPGVFFIPSRAVYRVRRRGKKWRIERRNGSVVKLIPLGEPVEFRARMEAAGFGAA